MSKRLDRLRQNPKGDWRIDDIIAVCREFGIHCDQSRSGSSHYKVAHPSRNEILTIPFKRPIKPVYIRLLVQFVDKVRHANE